MSKVFYFDNSDPEMKRANERARDTFRYFWRELSWEFRRIVPGLGVAAVKAPFFDGPVDDPGEVEHMWLNEIDFDGKKVTGVLLNEPNDVKSVSAGDKVSVPLRFISDWMYECLGQVYGGHTVQLMRSRMGRKERKQHDDAWGLNFGEPEVQLVPADYRDADGKIGEHPMSENMAPELAKQLRKNPEMLRDRDKRGWTLLHTEALAGNYSPVKVLLAAGADPAATTKDGRTPADLAAALGWKRVVKLLEG